MTLIDNLSVRIVVSGKAVGSGCVIFKDLDLCYVLTARHCLDSLNAAGTVQIQWYDYESLDFVGITVPLDDHPVVACPSDERYDGAILVFPVASLPVDVPPVFLSTAAGAGAPLYFRGFPKVLYNQEPEQLRVQVVFHTPYQIKLKVEDDVEDNGSEAFANVQGFSGSGLYQKIEEKIYVSGVIKEFQSGIPRFLAHDLSRLNALLKSGSLPELIFSDLPIVKRESKPADTGDFVTQCVKLLDDAERHWKALNPRQGFDIVRAVRKSIDDSALPGGQRNSLLSRVNYLEAFTGGDLKENVDEDSLFVSANLMMPGMKAYQERAANAYLNQEEPEKANEVAETILATDPTNPHAWLILTQLHPSQDVPESVKSHYVYKVGLLTKVRRKKGDGLVRISDLPSVFQEEISTSKLPNSIDRKNIFYWCYVAQYAMHEVFTKRGNSKDLKRPFELMEKRQLEYASNLLSMLSERVEISDFRNDAFFQIIRFEYCYCQYMLAENEEVRNQMADQLFDLFIGSKQVVPLPYTTHRPPVIDSIPQRLIDLLQILYSQGRGKKMLDAIAADALSVDNPILELFKGLAYGLEGDSPRHIESLKNFLSQTKDLDEISTVNFIDPIRFLRSIGTPLEEIYNLALVGKIFEQPYYKLILEALICGTESDRIDHARESAETAVNHWADMSDTQRRILARIYVDWKEWKTARELLADLCDEAHESEDLLFYIVAIFEERDDISLALRLAAHWRKNLTPHKTLVHYELAVLRYLRNYKMLEEIATYGIAHFPDWSHCWWDLVHALYGQRAEKHQDLITQLSIDRHLFNENFTLQTKFAIAHVCFVSGLTERGLEIAYRALRSNPENPGVQQAYFGLSRKYRAFDLLNVPETAQEDTVIGLRFGDSVEILELTKDNIVTNRIANAAVGKRVGESFQLHNPMIQIDEEYTVVEILNKYSGQLAKITKNIANPMSGMAIRVVKMDFDEAGEPDGEGFIKQIQELFGAGGTKSRLMNNEARDNFAKGKTGFTELCQGIYHGNAVAAWDYATCDGAGGFPIPPMYLQPEPDVEGNFAYVLDFTSLLCLFFLDKTQSIPFDGKPPFVVSQFLIDRVARDLEDARFEREAVMSAEILIGKTNAHVHTEDHQSKKIQFYQELMDWIDAHCEPDYAPERLTAESHGSEETNSIFSDQDTFGSILFDSLLLATRPNRILVTDDLLIFRSIGGGPVVRTTEFYLKTEFSELYENDLWLHMVAFNFRGLTLSEEQLFRVFKDSLLGQQNNYTKAAYSFSREYNPKPDIILSVIKFLKKLYTEDYAFDYKRKTSQALIRRYFTGWASINESVIRFIYAAIESEFRLMGDHVNHLKEDFAIVIASNW